jgi:RNA polymerase sigma factor (sigma-70 family)
LANFAKDHPLQLPVSNPCLLSTLGHYMTSDKALVEGCARGDRKVQQELYTRFSRKLLAICARYARSMPEAEDILQEGFVKAFDHIKNFRYESKLETWLTRIMINTALNFQRKKLYLFPMIDVEDIPLKEDEKISLSGFHFSELMTFVQSLPDGCRVVFNMFAIEGYSHKEISEMLSISEGTSKSQYSRARQLLMQRINSESKYGKIGEGTI